MCRDPRVAWGEKIHSEKRPLKITNKRCCSLSANSCWADSSSRSIPEQECIHPWKIQFGTQQSIYFRTVLSWSWWENILEHSIHLGSGKQHTSILKAARPSGRPHPPKRFWVDHMLHAALTTHQPFRSKHMLFRRIRGNYTWKKKRERKVADKRATERAEEPSHLNYLIADVGQREFST